MVTLSKDGETASVAVTTTSTSTTTTVSAGGEALGGAEVTKSGQARREPGRGRATVSSPVEGKYGEMAQAPEAKRASASRGSPQPGKGNRDGNKEQEVRAKTVAAERAAVGKLWERGVAWMDAAWGQERGEARGRGKGREAERRRAGLLGLQEAPSAVARKGREEREEDDEGGYGQQDQLLTSHPRRHYVIPPDIARPLVASSQLLLWQACAAAAVCVCCRGVPAAAWALPPLLLGTYLTSVNFWRCPAPCNRWRYADYFMVSISVLYGSFVTSVCTPAAFHAVWCRGWAAVAAIFVANETKFWSTRCKTRRDYALAVWVHLGAVHIGGNFLVTLALCALAGVGPWR